MANLSPNTLSFIALEANPEVITPLLHTLGLPSTFEAHDVYSLTEPDLLAMVPFPRHALLMVFPISKATEEYRIKEDADKPEYNEKGDDQVVWFPQTIRNACGMIALLHALSNGDAKDQITPGSLLDNLLGSSIDLPARERAKVLEGSSELATAHTQAASQGSTAAPEAGENIDLHYVCFVKGKDGTLWELDGRRKGPLARGKLAEDEDVLHPKAIEIGPINYLKMNEGDPRFSCLAICSNI